ncbi:MAG: FAD-dependent oxidoreductase [Patescibacteria group bacterium]|nr:FAD-dependent oxidoreductase [Patescibacteria group bacterium]
MNKQPYDLIIVGAGPAGYSAAIYAARYKINTLVLAKEIGGLAMTAPKVENWPGVLGKSGIDLMADFKKHVEHYGVKILMEEISDIKKENNLFTIVTPDKHYQAKTIILALGSERRKLNIPGEQKLTGKGVAYCATCDAIFCKGKIVAVVGGGNSAAVSTLLLAEHASKVYMIYRKDKLKAEPIWVDQILRNKKIEVIFNANVIEAKGEKCLQRIILDNGKELEVGGLFIEIGAKPQTELARCLKVNLDKNNLIIVDQACKTDVDGVFAAGDITTGSNELKQIVTAASEGAIAATSVYEYLKKNN